MGAGFSGPVPSTTADGRTLTVWLNANVIRNEDGRPYLLMGLSHDVTAALESEKRLRTTTRLLEALYEASADGILMIGTDDRILVANRRFGEFFDFDAAACVGKPDVELRNAAFRCLAEPESFEQRVRELYASPEMESEDELVLVAPAPRSLQRFTGPVRDAEGKLLGRLWIFRDVTARRAMERELRASKLEIEEKARVIAEADRLKSEFLAATSHDLRTPLNSLLGFLRLVLEGACTDRDEELQLLRHASDAGNHLLSLLNDILDLAKIESGNVSLSLGSVDLRGLLLELEPGVAVQAQAKGLTYRTQVPDGPPILVHSDYQRLRQVLLNLIGNAVKYTATGSVSVMLAAPSAGAQVRVVVTDTGIGMDEDTLQAARAGKVSSRGARGAGGLGLAIARRFVGLMAGSVFFDSPGLHRGTTVAVELPPIAQSSPGCPDKPAASPGAAEPAPATALRVLMVEDDPSTAHALGLALQRLGGCQVTVSEDVPTILGLAASGRVDLVLMDVSLVRSYYQGRLVDGLELTRLLKADERTRSLPVVLMTAYAMAGDRERMLRESGADDYEAKPIMDFRLLMSRLRRHCE
jgi:signal transduction histidine kinase